MSGWMDGWMDVAYFLRQWFSLSNHPCLFFLGHASWHAIFYFWDNHNLTLFYFKVVLRESLPRHGAFIDGKWMDDGAQFLI